jgi:hypothetical protein
MFKIFIYLLGVVMHASNPYTYEMHPGGLQVPGQFRIYSKILGQKTQPAKQIEFYLLV